MRKGISPIVSVMLILLIAIAITVLAIVWLPKFTFKFLPSMDFNTSYERSRGCLSIEDVKGLFGFVSIKNCGKVPLSDFRLFIDGQFVNRMGIDKLESDQSADLYDMPLSGGKHQIYMTSDNAESPPYEVDVPYWECMGGDPILSGDWYISTPMSCACSYNSKIPLNGILRIIENGSLSLYNCNLWLGGPNKYVYVLENGILNLTRSKITRSSDQWGYVTFEDSSKIFLLNSSVNDPAPSISGETNITAIDSDIGWPYIYSNMPNIINITDFIANPANSPITNYIKSNTTNFTLNFTNVRFQYMGFEISDNSNTTLDNVLFYPFTIVSEHPHNLTIVNYNQPYTGHFKAEGSGFELNATNLDAWDTRFYANGGSNNTIINSSFYSVGVDWAQNSTNRFFNFSSWGSWYLQGMNYTMYFDDFSWESPWAQTYMGDCGWNCISTSVWNFSRTTIIDRRWDFGSRLNVTMFGNITYLGNPFVGSFSSDNSNVTRYFPMIIKQSGYQPFPAAQPARIAINNNANQTVWQGSVSGGVYPMTYLIEDPMIVFNSSNYGPGNFSINVSQVCENISDVHFLSNTSMDFTVQKAFIYNNSFIASQVLGSPHGMAFDNAYFWISSSDGYVYKYNPSGTYNSKFNSNLNGLKDVTSNISYLWLLNSNSSEKKVYMYLPNGAYSSDFSVSEASQPYAVGFDGDNFWVLGSSAVYKYDAAGLYTGFSFNLNRISTPLSSPDIVAANGYLWIISDTNNEVFRYKTDGSYDNWYFDIAPSNGVRGLAYNGSYIWLLNSTAGVDMFKMNSKCLDVMKNCDEFVTFLPYNISKSNTRYCVLNDIYIGSRNAITFSSGVSNSTLDCFNHNVGGNDNPGKYGIYLNGSGTFNNTIKNCLITDFYQGIRLENGTNRNEILNNVLTSNAGSGIAIYSSYGNNIKGGLISSNPSDYFLFNSSNNNFAGMNFTLGRTINISDVKSIFSYSNYTGGGIRLNTSLSPPGVVTRKITSWGNFTIQFNDSASGATAKYNVSGLIPYDLYRVYNNSVLAYELQTDSGGVLPQFSIYLSGESEIRIKESGAPRYSLDYVNNSVSNRPTLFSLYWEDFVGLSGYIFSTNNTGAWVNDTWNSTFGAGSGAITHVSGQSGRATGTGSTIAVNMARTPIKGNVLIAAIATESDSYINTTSISQTGVTWSRAVIEQQPSPYYFVVEIWYGIVGSNPSSSATVNLISSPIWGSVADIYEYSGLDISNLLDKTATNYSSSGTTQADTGTTAATSQADELWIGAINAHLQNSGCQSLTDPTNGFTLYDGVCINGLMGVGFLEKIVSGTGNANAKATMGGSVSDAWFGAIATFRASASLSNVTKILNSTVGMPIGWRIYANDSENNWNASEVFEITTTDTPPYYSNPNINSTLSQKPTNFTLSWTDNINLSGYVFSTNNTGSWQNSSLTIFSGTLNTSWNVTVLNETTGRIIGWRFYAKDASDSWTESSIFTLNTT